MEVHEGIAGKKELSFNNLIKIKLCCVLGIFLAQFSINLWGRDIDLHYIIF